VRLHAPFAFNRRRRSHKDRIAITDVVAIVYCERQVVLDKQYGRKRSRQAEQWASDGSARHKSFERAGRAQRDRRCFVATAIYGADAPQTDLLRQWRDARLAPHAIGRAMIAVYYALSPAFVRWCAPRPSFTRGVRWLLDQLCHRLPASQPPEDR
jgi:hypothetical protein